MTARDEDLSGTALEAGHVRKDAATSPCTGSARDRRMVIQASAYYMNAPRIRAYISLFDRR